VFPNFLSGVLFRYIIAPEDVGSAIIVEIAEDVSYSITIEIANEKMPVCGNCRQGSRSSNICTVHQPNGVFSGDIIA